jgi:hypothetical protein
MRFARVCNALFLLCAVSLSGCGGKEAPEAVVPPPAASPASESPATAVAGDLDVMSSDEVCRLLQPQEVAEVIGATADAMPRQQVASSGVAIAACGWRNDDAKRELALLVIEGTNDESSRDVAASPPGGDAVPGIGDAAGVLLKGDHKVKVSVRSGSRMMTLEATGAGIADDREAVIAAARAAAGRLN